MGVNEDSFDCHGDVGYLQNAAFGLGLLLKHFSE